jgi:hypothetical protein
MRLFPILAEELASSAYGDLNLFESGRYRSIVFSAQELRLYFLGDTGVEQMLGQDIGVAIGGHVRRVDL